MHNHTHVHENFFDSIMLCQWILALPFMFALLGYMYGVIQSNRYFRKWPISRVFLFLLGILCALFGVIGPLAQQAHIDFAAHMLAHLLLGMLSPLFVAAAQPLTLLLRTLHVDYARLLSHILKHKAIRLFSHPIVASVLNIGSMWLLYTTSFYSLMHQNFLFYLLVHIHFFLAGYFSTVSMVYFDPTPHQTRFLYRGVVMLIALAGHEILSKYIYAHPPDGVSVEQAQLGGLLMYYGGDAIELVMIILFFKQWFRSIQSKKTISINTYFRS